MYHFRFAEGAGFTSAIDCSYAVVIYIGCWAWERQAVFTAKLLVDGDILEVSVSCHLKMILQLVGLAAPANLHGLSIK